MTTSNDNDGLADLAHGGIGRALRNGEHQRTGQGAACGIPTPLTAALAGVLALAVVKLALFFTQ